MMQYFQLMKKNKSKCKIKRMLNNQFDFYHIIQSHSENLYFLISVGLYSAINLSLLFFNSYIILIAEWNIPSVCLLHYGHFFFYITHYSQKKCSHLVFTGLVNYELQTLHISGTIYSSNFYLNSKSSFSSLPIFLIFNYS